MAGYSSNLSNAKLAVADTATRESTPGNYLFSSAADADAVKRTSAHQGWPIQQGATRSNRRNCREL